MSTIARTIYCFSYLQLVKAVLISTLLVAAVVMVEIKTTKKSVGCTPQHGYLYWCIAVGFVVFSLVPLAMTLLFRDYGATRALTPYPGRMLYRYFVLGEEEGMRMLLMNTAFFVPLGSFTAALACCRRKSPLQKKRILKGLCRLLVAALLFSFLLEVGQFILACGESEVDDLICNTLGAGIGYLLVHFWVWVITLITRVLKAVFSSRTAKQSEEPPHNNNKNQ